MTSPSKNDLIATWKAASDEAKANPSAKAHKAALRAAKALAQHIERDLYGVVVTK